MRMPNGSLKLLVEGLSRAKMTRTFELEGFLAVEYQDIPTTHLQKSVKVEALWRTLQKLYEQYSKLNEKAPADLMSMARSAEDIDTLADTLAVHLNLSFDERQNILETADLIERLEKLSTLLKKELAILETEQRIRGRVQTQVEKSQREFYLMEQIKAIHKELGREDHQVEIAQVKARMKGLGLSAEALEKVDKELKRLEQMQPMSSEAAICRHYIDWIVSLPWKKKSKDTISLTQAEKMLNGQHAGLKKAKERIIEFIAAKKFSKSMERSPILCLIGPPGVGKTSLANSIAESLGRECVRISLGGIKDEAEIRGHRRTYIGALPGKIIQGMKKAKTINPVIILDEIDKMSRDVHGDPAAALLEVLDPEQNKTFTDHFLDMEYDLSRVMFIATANTYEGIPYPLLDRMEMIGLSGYTEEEKLEIARKFLLPKNLKEYSLDAEQFKISDDLLRIVIAHYTKEAGVRTLERTVAKLMRKAIQELLQHKNKTSVTITPAFIKEWLGNYKFRKTSLDLHKDRIGLATGLAWTEVGGDVLEIEASVINGKGGMTLTGQLGEVMQESAQAALSYIRARAAELNLRSSFYSSKDIHIHIPEGATPKDGPSAGITMCLALISALTKNPTKQNIAMTGEITLRGRVLAVGGLKEKILAAKQHDMHTVLVPRENEDDIEEMLRECDPGVKIIFLDTMDDVLKLALMRNPFIKTNGTTHDEETPAKKNNKKKTAKKR
jgi:ATP-dependent Lon protease